MKYDTSDMEGTLDSSTVAVVDKLSDYTHEQKVTVQCGHLLRALMITTARQDEEVELVMDNDGFVCVRSGSAEELTLIGSTQDNDLEPFEEPSEEPPTPEEDTTESTDDFLDSLS